MKQMILKGRRPGIFSSPCQIVLFLFVAAILVQVRVEGQGFYYEKKRVQTQQKSKTISKTTQDNLISSTTEISGVGSYQKPTKTVKKCLEVIDKLDKTIQNVDRQMILDTATNSDHLVSIYSTSLTIDDILLPPIIDDSAEQHIQQEYQDIPIVECLGCSHKTQNECPSYLTFSNTDTNSGTTAPSGVSSAESSSSPQFQLDCQKLIDELYRACDGVTLPLNHYYNPPENSITGFWDDVKDELRVGAARCGCNSAPSSIHMWKIPFLLVIIAVATSCYFHHY